MPKPPKVAIKAKRAAKKAAPGKNKSHESWIWDAACSIRGAKDAPKYKDFILPLCDVFDDELNRIAAEIGLRKKAFQLAKRDHKLVRIFLPLEPADPEQPVWSVIGKLSDKIGEGVTTHMRAIAKENPPLQSIIDRVDFNATTHGQRDINDDRLSNLIEKTSEKRLGLEDVEADTIGKSSSSDEFDRFPAGAGSPGKSSAIWGRTQHIFASLKADGRAAVVWDTGAVSNGSGKAGDNKEKTVRQWFADRDLVESVLSPPEPSGANQTARQGSPTGERGGANQNLFYNTSAPGIVLFLHAAKPKARQGKVFLVNASQIFEKGNPKNFIPDEGIQRIADILIGWKEEENLSRIVDHAELTNNDYNISPSRYVHTRDAETYRPIAEIVAELDAIEAEAKETDKALRKILKQLSI